MDRERMTLHSESGSVDQVDVLRPTRGSGLAEFCMDRRLLLPKTSNGRVARQSASIVKKISA